MNGEQIYHLAKGYGFEYQIFFQPIGYFNSDNPFIKDSASFRSEYKCFDQLLEAQQTIRDQIASNSLTNFYDISQAHKGCKDCYVDLVHYSGPFNRRLAELILESQN